MLSVSLPPRLMSKVLGLFFFRHTSEFCQSRLSGFVLFFSLILLSCFGCTSLLRIDCAATATLTRCPTHCEELPALSLQQIYLFFLYQPVIEVSAKADLHTCLTHAALLAFVISSCFSSHTLVLSGVAAPASNPHTDLLLSCSF